MTNEKMKKWKNEKLHSNIQTFKHYYIRVEGGQNIPHSKPTVLSSRSTTIIWIQLLYTLQLTRESLSIELWLIRCAPCMGSDSQQLNSPAPLRGSRDSSFILPTCVVKQKSAWDDTCPHAPRQIRTLSTPHPGQATHTPAMSILTKYRSSEVPKFSNSSLTNSVCIHRTPKANS
jgi:hypothetical protein